MSFNIVKHTKIFLGKNGPVICAAGATVMLIGAVAAAIHDTPKALTVLENERAVREEQQLPPMTKLEVVKLTAPCYIPTIAATVTSGVCIVASVVSGQKRYAALAAASALTETAFRNFKESAKDVLTPEEYKKVHERVADTTLERHHARAIADEDIELTGHGNTLCIESWSGKPFRASKEWVEHCINMVNERMRNENWVTLADLLDEIGVYNVGKGCSTLCWEINDNGYIIPAFSSKLYEGEPALVIDYVNEPSATPI